MLLKHTLRAGSSEDSVKENLMSSVPTVVKSTAMQSPLRANASRLHLRDGNSFDKRRLIHKIAAPTFNVCDNSGFLSLEPAHNTLDSRAAFTGTRAIRSPTALNRRVHTHISVRDVSQPAHVVVLSRLAPLLSPMLQERCGRNIESVSVVDPKDPDVQVGRCISCMGIANAPAI